MNFRNLFLLLTFSLFFVSFAQPSFGVQRSSKPDLKLVGSVVADESVFLRLLALTDVPMRTFFIVRVDRVDDGNEASRYIRVGYEYMAPNYQLPQDLFKIPATWKFALRRQAACDGPLPSDSKLKDIKTGRDTGETINPVRIINPDEKIPEGKVMPCYILVDGGIKKAT